MPGACAIAAQTSRALGISVSSSLVKLVPIVVVVVSTTGDSPVTVTVSCSVATWSCWSTLRRLVDDDADAFALHGLEAGELEVDRVDAGRQRHGSGTTPSLPVTCTWGWMSAGLDAVTVTPGSTAPVLSVTVPLIRPRKSCAEAGSTPKSSAARHRIRTCRLQPHGHPSRVRARARLQPRPAARACRPTRTNVAAPVDPAQPLRRSKRSATEISCSAGSIRTARIAKRPGNRRRAGAGPAAGGHSLDEIRLSGSGGSGLLARSPGASGRRRATPARAVRPPVTRRVECGRHAHRRRRPRCFADPRRPRRRPAGARRSRRPAAAGRHGQGGARRRPRRRGPHPGRAGRDLRGRGAAVQGGEARAELYARKFRELGLQNVRIDKAGNVLGERPGTTPRPHFVLAAHLDTVFPEGTNVKTTQEGTVIRGPGIGDDCRGLAVVLAVVRALQGRQRPDAGHHHLRRQRRRGRPRRPARREVPLQRRPEGARRSLRLDRRHRPGHHPHLGRQPALPRDLQGARRPQLRRVRHGRTRSTRWAGRWRRSPTSRCPREPKTTFNVGRIGGGTSVNSIPVRGLDGSGHAIRRSPRRCSRSTPSSTRRWTTRCRPRTRAGTAAP